MNLNVIAAPRGVEFGVLVHGQGAAPNEEIVHGEFHALLGKLLVERRAQLEQFLHVEADSHLVMRDRRGGFDEAARDDLSHVRQRHNLILKDGGRLDDGARQ